MRSLQVVTPNMKCIYNCPFCISKTHIHDNAFKDNYSLNKKFWKDNLAKVIKENDDLKYVVITGTNEPMQSIECVKDIINIVRNESPDIQIEIQTHYYKDNDIYKNLDVVAYSIPFYNLTSNIKPSGKTNRYVFILTDTFNDYRLSDILKITPDNVSQITFKVLQKGNEASKEVNDYINSHSISIDSLNKLREDINSYNGNLSIRLDENCMDTTNRYKIFREDGYLYNDWEEESKSC